MHISAYLWPRNHENVFVFLGKQSLQVQMLMLRIRSSAKNFHKIIENPDCGSQEVKYQSRYLLRRSSNFGPLKGGSDSIEGHSNFLTSTPRFCYQPKEMCVRSYSGNSFFGDDGKCNLNVSSADCREIIESEISVHFNVEQPSNNHIRLDKISGSSLLDMSSSNASQNSITFSPKSSDSIAEKKQLLHENSRGITSCSERAYLVDKEPRATKRKVNNTSQEPGFTTDRCLQKGVGCILSGNKVHGPRKSKVSTSMSWNC